MSFSYSVKVHIFFLPLAKRSFCLKRMNRGLLMSFVETVTKEVELSKKKT